MSLASDLAENIISHLLETDWPEKLINKKIEGLNDIEIIKMYENMLAKRRKTLLMEEWSVIRDRYGIHDKDIDFIPMRVGTKCCIVNMDTGDYSLFTVVGFNEDDDGINYDIFYEPGIDSKNWKCEPVADDYENDICEIQYVFEEGNEANYFLDYGEIIKIRLRDR